MLKISEIETGNEHALLRLEGRLAGPWVTEMRNASEKILKTGRPLKLDLGEVTFADQNGVAAMAQLKTRGVELLGCSSFLEEQLKVTPAA